MTIEEDTWGIDQWELDECRYCKGPIDDPSEAYCSASCELKWIQQQDEQADNSPPGSSVFSSQAEHSLQSTPRSTPASSAQSSPEFQPILPPGSVPVLPLDLSTTLPERRNSYALRPNIYGSSHNPVKKSFPSNYYQSTIGDRSSVQPIFADKSVSLGIRKNSIDDIRPRPLPPVERTSSSEKKLTTESANPSSRHSGLWSWRRLSALM